MSRKLGFTNIPVITSGEDKVPDLYWKKKVEKKLGMKIEDGYKKYHDTWREEYIYEAKKIQFIMLSHEFQTIECRFLPKNANEIFETFKGKVIGKLEELGFSVDYEEWYPIECDNFDYMNSHFAVYEISPSMLMNIIASFGYEYDYMNSDDLWYVVYDKKDQRKS